MNLELIKSSVQTYFDSVKPDGFRLYFEGQTIDTVQFTEWGELRINGPRIKKMQGLSRYIIDINIMCSVKNGQNIYRADQLASYFASKMEVIPVKDVDDELITCFSLRNDMDHQLEVVQWGRVEVNQISTMQCSIEGFYQMETDK